MKFCPNCSTALEDSATFCTVCGANLNAPPAGAPVYAQPIMNNFDHTAEFDANDVAENKFYASLGYIFGFIGVIIALLARRESPFVDFHVRQALKISIVSSLLSLVTVVLCITILVPLAASALITALTVIQYISFFDTLKGNAKEPAIIRNLKFLK